MSTATKYLKVPEYEGQCGCGEQFVLHCTLTVDVCGGSVLKRKYDQKFRKFLLQPHSSQMCSMNNICNKVKETLSHFGCSNWWITELAKFEVNIWIHILPHPLFTSGLN